ncbi:MAG: membrane protein insertase YidC [Alphaproteobacteria bacterium]|nr:membrane protein insertase YidC [Alphaproteobacteria bacterium]
MNKNDNNVFLAIVLSFAILVGFQYFYVKPQQASVHTRQVTQQVTPKGGQAPVVAKPAVQALRDRNEIVSKEAASRVRIDTPELSGSINLKGARFDDLTLMNYLEKQNQKSPRIVLLSPSGSDEPHPSYYAEFNWLADSISIAVPSADTLWKSDGKALTPDHSVRLFWNNQQGQVFERTVAVDDKAMFTITDRIVNKAAAPVTFYPFGIVARRGMPVQEGRSSVVHEGGLGVLGGTLEEFKYTKLIDSEKKSLPSVGGWLGMTDKYWLVAMIPPQTEKLVGEFAYNRAGAKEPEKGFFQSDFRGAPVTVPAGGSVERVMHFFAGAKRVSLLDRYADKYAIPHFDRAIDFGWFYFLTRPFLYLLTAIEHMVGHMGIAILLFTVLLKLGTFYFSQKSYHSMSRMKAIQPEMKRIQERYADDKVKQSQEMMELYKREKVNPMSGCMPMLVQIPIFFALYKVLNVNIEMRGAPFFGWIRDMSVPDPTSWFNLFGLAPWSVVEQISVNLGLFTLYLPPALHIGAWPFLMGISMILQQKMSPQPPDRSQARMMTFMPIFFTYLLSSMPAGLVIYWTWSNLLGILQQWYSMRKDAKRRAAA